MICGWIQPSFLFRDQGGGIAGRSNLVVFNYISPPFPRLSSAHPSIPRPPPHSQPSLLPLHYTKGMSLFTFHDTSIFLLPQILTRSFYLRCLCPDLAGIVPWILTSGCPQPSIDPASISARYLRRKEPREPSPLRHTIKIQNGISHSFNLPFGFAITSSNSLSLYSCTSEETEHSISGNCGTTQ